MPICPLCNSSCLYRDGLRYFDDGSTIQRWLCRSCGYRFSESKKQINITSQVIKSSNSGNYVHDIGITSRDCVIKKTLNDLSLKISKDVASHKPSNLSITEKSLKPLPDYNRYAKVCASNKEAKNLETTTNTKTVVETKSQNAKGKIIEFVWKLQNEGYRAATIKSYSRILKQLARLGADILNPESVKESIAKQKQWDENTKLFAVTAYQCFLDQTLNITWKMPKYRKQEKIPYIPTIEDVNALIAGSGKKLAAFLTLLRETGARCGEAIRVEWTEIDTQRKTVRIQAEKNSKPRILPISNQLIAMLERIPKKAKKIFTANLNSMRSNLQITRARQAHKLSNPRLLKISFHSLRHLKGTTEYHKTHDIIHVQQSLGHRDIGSTMKYIHYEAAIYHSINTDDFHVKIAETVKEACKLIETGFEYVTEIEGKKLFRKRK